MALIQSTARPRAKVTTFDHGECVRAPRRRLRDHPPPHLSQSPRPKGQSSPSPRKWSPQASLTRGVSPCQPTPTTSWLLPPSSPPWTVGSVELWVCAIGLPPPVPSGSRCPTITIPLPRPAFTIPSPRPATIPSPHPYPPPKPPLSLPMPSFHNGMRSHLAGGGCDVTVSQTCQALHSPSHDALLHQNTNHAHLTRITILINCTTKDTHSHSVTVRSR
ncbi:hypothetical protein DPX16_13980 [Anabarilius grahami]|uniref:Uncharacterized protein n=1 Tax=Anabarilius grahami TaxID=495550 RepID=A0A3N0Y8L9_ANAGA|nr:hypothetical protein DPX16_13980 [Anabarilius grahami]